MDPRKIPYLLVWTSSRDGCTKEGIRVTRYGVDAIELKRSDGSVVVIYLVWRRLPRGGGRSLLLSCWRCVRPCRALYGAEVGDDGHFHVVQRADWECRKCAKLRYSSEGGRLLIRPRRRLARLLGRLNGPDRCQRPNAWFPYVFTSPEAAFAAGIC